MNHDPERDAAAYIEGDLDGELRRDFESHMLRCDRCWAEVTSARRGRALAEALREPAPQSARERLRAVAATSPAAVAEGMTAPGATQRRPWAEAPRRAARTRVLLATAATVVVIAPATLFLGDSGGDGAADPLAAAASVYHAGGQAGGSTQLPSPPTRRIGSLAWRGTAVQDLDGHPAILHRYADPAGRQVLLVSSAHRFPRAPGAEDVDGGPSWIAEVGDAVMFCADKPGVSWLAIGSTRQQALAAGRGIGLR